MKQQLILSFFLIFNLHLFAQNEPLSVSLSYLGHYGFQPGMKIGINWRPAGQADRSSGLIVSPHIGYFSRPGYHANMLLGSAFGWHMPHASKRSYSAFSLSLNYLYHSEILTTRTGLDGSIIDKIRESRHFFLPMIAYEYGRQIYSRMDVFFKGSAGPRLSPSRESSTNLFFELGIVYRLSD